jgi:hypothetical protein
MIIFAKLGVCTARLWWQRQLHHFSQRISRYRVVPMLTTPEASVLDEDLFESVHTFVTELLHGSDSGSTALSG